MSRILNYLKYKYMQNTKDTHVHVEAIHLDRVWKLVQDRIGAYSEWFVITPVNYILTKVQINNYLSQEEWEQLLIQRYNAMKDMGATIQLHVHTVIDLNLIGEETYGLQLRLIETAYDWLRKNVVRPTKLSMGWFIDDKNTEAIAKQLDLKLIRKWNNPIIHDYEFIYGHVKR